VWEQKIQRKNPGSALRQKTGLKLDSVWTHDEWWQVQDVGPQDNERQFGGVDWVEVQVLG